MTLRLLVVDDDPDHRLILRHALEGCEDLVLVGEAASTDEVAAADLVDVDVVVLDASLPGVLGLAEVVGGSATRLVLTSSLPAPYVTDAVVRSGAVGSLAKDIPVARLPAAIRELGSLAGAVERAMHTARRSLPGEPASARASRQALVAALEGWASDEITDAAELLVSEVVTNVVRHAGTDLDVGIAIGPTTVRVEITDRNPELPVMRSPEPTDVGGRGMRIVAELASRWGIDARRSGKSVWFELPRRRPSGA